MSSSAPLDPVALTADLIRLPSVTPRDEGAMDLVERHLTQLGFSVERLKFGEIENLYARRGTAGRNLCFAGHTDVVPPGDTAAWACDPFAAEVADGVLIGRGAADMKGGIAAFLAAVSRLPDHPGSLSFLITGDEEGAAVDGTKRVVAWLAAKGERIDHCLVGEPTSVSALGDMIKIGRRGSLNATVTVRGRQGHVAYPHRAANPIPVLIDLLAALKAMPLDNGYEGFQPSNLELTTVDVGNPATNVIPAEASARLNIRFNPAHTGAQLVERLTGAVDAARAQSGLEITLDARISGEAFLTRPDSFVDDLVSAITSVTGLEPELSTTGGTSDARFIRALCPVVEFGLPGATMHQVNEAVRVADLERLADIYEALIRRYGAAKP